MDDACFAPTDPAVLPDLLAPLAQLVHEETMVRPEHLADPAPPDPSDPRALWEIPETQDIQEQPAPQETMERAEARACPVLRDPLAPLDPRDLPGSPVAMEIVATTVDPARKVLLENRDPSVFPAMQDLRESSEAPEKMPSTVRALDVVPPRLEDGLEKHQAVCDFSTRILISF